MDKSNLIKSITDKLFEPEARRLASMINDLNTKNKELRAVSVDGFLYGGKLYMPSGVSTIVRSGTQSKVTLHFSLNQEMETWLWDCKIIKTDQDLIKQMLFLLLKHCTNEQDLRDTLPECLINLVFTQPPPRRNQPGYTLEDNERAQRQFQTILPKMELYSSTRLFY